MVMGFGSSARLATSACLLVSVLCSQAPSAASEGRQSEGKAPAAGASTTDGHGVLVELFTSEGCSSCPPADALLQQMDSSPPVAGAQLIVLSEHVDYWDRDGWKDPYSSAAATERQSAYVHVLGLSTAYTPQFIVDGSDELHGDPQQASQVILNAAEVQKVPVHIDSPVVNAQNPTLLQTHIEADGSSEKHNADIYVAIALDHAESQVLRGENSGRHLTHVAVLQSLTKIGKLEEGKNFGRDIQLNLKPGTDPANVRVVAFVQEAGPGKVLGAASRRSDK